jgi:hypothetical protein
MRRLTARVCGSRAGRAAEDALLDQTLIRIDPDSHQHYLDILDETPDSDGFRRLRRPVDQAAQILAHAQVDGPGLRIAGRLCGHGMSGRTS